MIRDLFDALGNAPGDPMEAARRAMRQAIPKRFYRKAAAGEAEGGFALLLDGKTAKTPAGKPLVLPTRALAEAIVAEWQAQEETIDPAKMPLTRLANLAIDQAEKEAPSLRAEIRRYAASDHVLYRAGEPEGLVVLQAAHWDPIVEWAHSALGARLILAEGVNFVAQPETALAAIGAEVENWPPPFALAALASLTSLAGSALIALALARGRLSTVEAWNAAHVDEDWNIRQWGEDSEAAHRRAGRLSEFEAAAKMLALLDRK
ncbi:MAG TPA: ATP12 family protein [Xanthobacteraceae bacterium]|nr:ATP12 family protein [Xanthobacteraceae bacterium]